VAFFMCILIYERAPHRTMFSDWTDPSDINYYYGAMNDVFNGVTAAPSSVSNMQHSEPIKVSAPVSVPIPTQVKSTFDVKPNTIFSDDHPVGHQPKFNILRSAPRETYANNPNHLNNPNHHPIQYDWTYMFIIVVAFIFMTMLYLNLRSNYCHMQQSMYLLMHLLFEKQQRKE